MTYRTGYLDEIDPDLLEVILNDINNEEENFLNIPPLNVDISPIKNQVAVNKSPSKKSGSRIFYGSAPKVKKCHGDVKPTFSDLVNAMINARKKHVPTAEMKKKSLFVSMVFPHRFFTLDSFIKEMTI
ncbi:hypothetical protein RYX36_017300 [Vicia faba]